MAKKRRRRRQQLDDSPFPFTTGETAMLSAHLSTLAYEKGYAEGFQMGIAYAKSKAGRKAKVR